jgi:ankyrin repeat protein
MRHTTTFCMNQGIALLVTLTLAHLGQAQVYRADTAPRDKALMEACIRGSVETATAALDQGADPNFTLVGGRTALHWAAANGHHNVVRLLIDRGANVNSQDDTGRTPLVEAAGAHNPQGLKLLLEVGAKSGGLELGMACWLGRIEHIKLLLDTGVNPDHGIAKAALGGHVDVIKLLLEKGASVEAMADFGGAPSGNTPLHNAASQGGLKAVELLLEKGANPNAVNQQGQTPLHRAIAGDGDLARIKRLVAFGAKLDIADKEGLTPVRMAGMSGGGPIYDFLLTASGGKEPDATQPAQGAAGATAKGARSTKELIAMLTAGERRDDFFVPKNSEAHAAAQRELALRGSAVMPEVLQAIEGGAPLESFHGLLTALGPKAEAALPVLAKQLKDKERVILAAVTMERVKAGALKDLSPADKQAAADSIYAWIVGKQVDVTHGFALDLLAKTGISKPYFLQLLRHSDANYRRLGASYLGDRPYSDAEMEAEVLKLSRDADRHVRDAAIRALGNSKSTKSDSRQALLSVLKNAPSNQLGETDPEKISQFQLWQQSADRAAYSIARLGPSVIDDLVPLLSPMEAPSRGPAIIALKEIGAPAVPRLVELLGSKDLSVATSAGVALSKIGSSAPPALAEALKSGNDQVRERAASALWWLGRAGKIALPNLLEVAGSDNSADRTRFTAARAALKIEPQCRESKEILAAIPMLIRMLERGEYTDQIQAAAALEAIGPPARDALPLLRERMKPPRNENLPPGTRVRDFDHPDFKRAVLVIEGKAAESR